ncbi:Alpha/Beta hydrolase protein [Sphaerosporella brunnea]|uniref:Alpha/Beta hydrolase protein n=1 Tax=Sphaerosporella brunnea TaxID=1250544 RepID=A0A5J5F7E8_9PEZI|nr:Alpha/Beta hydrolase protein [Sphaerosporella brunnea]
MAGVGRDTSKTAMLKLVLPHVPHLLLRSSAHLLRLSSTSQYWDFKSTLTVEFIRSMLATPANPPVPIEKHQRHTTKPTPVAANTWCVPINYSPSEDFDGEARIRDAIVALGGEEDAILVTPAAELSGEWISYRSSPLPSNTPNVPDYPALLANTEEKEAVVLYLHGGAYCLCDPHTHRPAVARLCKSTKTRAFVPRYRLAPQSAFPGPLLDALVSYLFLLYPPPGSLHDPIPAEKIVFAGDSAGGNLSLSLLLLTQYFKRAGIPVSWYGRSVSVPLPAGVAGSSAWCEISRCFGSLASFPQGSEDTCQPSDYLPCAVESAKVGFAESPGWNEQLRKEKGMTQLYAPDKLMAHPLVSPLLSETWDKEVPVYLSIGDERLRDSNLFLAHRLLEAGVPTRFEWYEGMPHVFPAILMHTEAARQAWEGMAGFVCHATGVETKSAQEMWGAWKWHPKTLQRTAVEAEELKCYDLEFHQVREMVRTAIVRFRELFKEAQEGRRVAERVGAVEGAARARI